MAFFINSPALSDFFQNTQKYPDLPTNMAQICLYSGDFLKQRPNAGNYFPKAPKELRAYLKQNAPDMDLGVEWLADITSRFVDFVHIWGNTDEVENKSLVHKKRIMFPFRKWYSKIGKSAMMKGSFTRKCNVVKWVLQ